MLRRRIENKPTAPLPVAAPRRTPPCAASRTERRWWRVRWPSPQHLDYRGVFLPARAIARGARRPASSFRSSLAGAHPDGLFRNKPCFQKTTEPRPNLVRTAWTALLGHL